LPLPHFFSPHDTEIPNPGTQYASSESTYPGSADWHAIISEDKYDVGFKETFMKKTILIIMLLAITGMIVAAPQSPNSLTTKEKAEGWRLLFDGTTFNGWRGYLQKEVPSAAWKIEGNVLKTVPKAKGELNLITTDKFNDFEFSWEWSIAPGGNNGIKYFVTEARPSAPGHEYQMIDDQTNAENKNGPTHATAAFYDVLPASDDKPLKPAGQWNVSRVVVRGNHVEHWLNGKKVLEYELGSDAVKAGIAKSKFSKFPDFGTKIQGHIMLTYHNDECSYRNLKIRELPVK
jgi:hypothetical protein